MRDFAKILHVLWGTEMDDMSSMALAEYFRSANQIDADWAVSILRDEIKGAAISSTRLKQLAVEFSGLESWLLELSHKESGDLAEALAYFVEMSPDGPAKIEPRAQPSLSAFVRDVIKPIQSCIPSERRDLVFKSWRLLASRERVVWNKLLLGKGIGIEPQILVRALSLVSGVGQPTIEWRLLKSRGKAEGVFHNLVSPESEGFGRVQMPQFQAVERLDPEWRYEGPVSELWVERHFAGEEVQVVRSEDDCVIWDTALRIRNEDWPGLVDVGLRLPTGTILDGQVVADESAAETGTQDGARFIAHDLLLRRGRECRSDQFTKRRENLESMIRELQLKGAGESGDKAEQGELFDGYEFGPAVDKPPVPCIAVSTRLFAIDQKHIDELLAQCPAANGTGLRIRVPPSNAASEGAVDWWFLPCRRMKITAVATGWRTASSRKGGLEELCALSVRSGDEWVAIGNATLDQLPAADRRDLLEMVQTTQSARFGPFRTLRPSLVIEVEFERFEFHPNRHKSPRLVGARVSCWHRHVPVSASSTMEQILVMAGGRT